MDCKNLNTTPQKLAEGQWAVTAQIALDVFFFFAGSAAESLPCEAARFTRSWSPKYPSWQASRDVLVAELQWLGPISVLLAVMGLRQQWEATTMVAPREVSRVLLYHKVYQNWTHPISLQSQHESSTDMLMTELHRLTTRQNRFRAFQGEVVWTALSQPNSSWPLASPVSFKLSVAGFRMRSTPLIRDDTNSSINYRTSLGKDRRNWEKREISRLKFKP